MLLRRFVTEYTSRQLLVLAVEQMIQPFIAWIPGLTGFTIRYIYYKITFNKMGGYCYVAPNVTMQRSYGISVGKRLAINRGSLIDGKGNVSIGDDVIIGPYVVITSAQHSYSKVNMPIIMQSEVKGEVVIGNDVWIGAHVVINPGVRIGNRVIIGAGSIVTRDIPSHSIAVGAPARTIKHLP